MPVCHVFICVGFGQVQQDSQLHLLLLDGPVNVRVHQWRTSHVHGQCTHTHCKVLPRPVVWYCVTHCKVLPRPVVWYCVTHCMVLPRPAVWYCFMILFGVIIILFPVTTLYDMA